MNKIYAGIGSRKTPGTTFWEKNFGDPLPEHKDVWLIMYRLGYWMGKHGWTLRSGAASGADTAFEGGAKRAGTAREIFIPWRSFSKDPDHIVDIPDGAYPIAQEFHPAWDRLSDAVRTLMARNVCQILGQDLSTPVDRVICWTPGGSGSGGTGQAIRIARHYGITVRDLGNAEDYKLVADWLNSVRNK